jgi:uncharacterized cupin superfamily protein
MKRVVTGWDESAKPTILFEGEPPTVMDFGPIVFEGREITLRPGDSVVQQGTPHDWINKGTVPCVVAGVLVSTRA